jgi:hypothetical protein
MAEGYGANLRTWLGSDEANTTGQNSPVNAHISMGGYHKICLICDMQCMVHMYGRSSEVPLVIS